MASLRYSGGGASVPESPPTDAWAAACGLEQQRAAKYHLLTSGIEPRRINATGASRHRWSRRRPTGNASGGLAAALARLLHARGTLCSDEPGRRCNVTAFNATTSAPRNESGSGAGATLHYRICLPGGGTDALFCQPVPKSAAFVNRKACKRGAHAVCFTYSDSTLRGYLERIKVAAKRPGVVRANLTRCAVVMTGHSIRCGRAWGAAIDNAYSAVFRTAVPSLGAEATLRSGRRADYIYTSGCKTSSFSYLRSRCLDSKAFPFLHRRDTLLGTNLGVGHSGGFVLDVAIAHCASVDVFGMGLFSFGAGRDLIYQHSYDARFAPRCPTRCLLATNEPAEVAAGFSSMDNRSQLAKRSTRSFAEQEAKQQGFLWQRDANNLNSTVCQPEVHCDDPAWDVLFMGHWCSSGRKRRAAGECEAATNASERRRAAQLGLLAHPPAGHSVAEPRAKRSLPTHLRSSERPADFVFLSELRLHVLHALGAINWIWY